MRRLRKGLSSVRETFCVSASDILNHSYANMSPDKTSVADTTKKCQKCGEEVLKEATKCKHCGSDLRPIYQRRPVLSCCLALPVGFFALFILMAFFGSVASKSPSTSNTAIVLSDEQFQASLDTDKPKVQTFWDQLKDKLKSGDDTDSAMQAVLQNPSSGYDVYQRLTQAANIDDMLSDQIADLPVPDLADNQSEQMLKDGLASLSDAFRSKRYAYEQLAKFINSAATSSDYEKMSAQKASATTGVQLANEAVEQGLAKLIPAITKYGVTFE